MASFISYIRSVFMAVNFSGTRVQIYSWSEVQVLNYYYCTFVTKEKKKNKEKLEHSQQLAEMLFWAISSLFDLLSL